MSRKKIKEWIVTFKVERLEDHLIHAATVEEAMKAFPDNLISTHDTINWEAQKAEENE